MIDVAGGGARPAYEKVSRVYSNFLLKPAVGIVALLGFIMGPGPGSRSVSPVHGIDRGRPVRPPGLDRLHYGVIDLGSLGGANTWVNALNERGAIAGISETAEHNRRAFVWQAGVMTDLGTLGGMSSQAVAMNNSGVIVGGGDVVGGVQHAFRWSHGTMSDLGTLGGRYSVATAVNERGQIAGDAQTRSGEYRAFFWADGVMTDLGTLGGIGATTFGMNARGEVIGVSGNKKNAPASAFIWHAGRMRPLSVPVGFSSPVAINDLGHVLLEAMDVYGNPIRAFLWRDGSAVDIGMYQAVGLDNLDQVIGWRSAAGGPQAAVWQNGRIADLPGPPGWNLSARALNDQGVIAGAGGPGTSQQPLVWQLNQFAALPTPGFDGARPDHVNNRGMIIGAGFRANSGIHALYWSPVGPAARPNTG